MNCVTEDFMIKAKTSHDLLVKNMRELMRSQELSGIALAKKSRVSIRMINSILAKERTPTLRILDQISAAFGLTGWQMILPGIPQDKRNIGLLEHTVMDYLQTSDIGRQYIAHVAQKEAQYNTAPPNPASS